MRSAATSRQAPDAEAAAAIGAEVLGCPAWARRFETGLRHYVFEVVSDRGRAVVRLSRPEDARIAEDALYWSKLLRPLDVPMPEVLAADTTMRRHPYPYLVLERLAGQDLGQVIDTLGKRELRRLAHRLSAVQSIVSALPPGRGYGFAGRLEGPFPQSSWADSVAASLARSRRRIRNAGIVEEALCDRVASAAEALSGYLANVQSTPFLHDITTKNVILDGPRLSGIVDVDDLCFGDSLFLLGLTRTALLAHRKNPFYVEAWLEILSPNSEQRAALDFYTALFCLDFMSELGQRFNRGAPLAADRGYLQRLRDLLARYLT